MQNKTTLSIVISAFNEENKIRDCLESAKWADEIIFLDNSSTDNTTVIAKEYTKKIISQVNNPEAIDIQKNTGIEKASGDWILVLDADERITAELAKEVQTVINSGQQPLNGYLIPRRNIIFGKWIKHTGWYPDPQLRLFKKGKGKFEHKHVHEPLKVEGQTATLHSQLLHYNFETIPQFLHKHMDVYAPNEAEELIREGYTFAWKDAVRMPLKEFLSRYFAREGYKDGFHGFMLSIFMAFYHFVIFAYIWEKNNFKDVDTQDFASLQNDLEQEFKKAGQEVQFWVYNEKIKYEKNSVNKLLLKTKRKLKI